MTYHNKLIFKRILMILAVIAAVVLVLAVIGFTYLGRYVVYTEKGAYFSFLGNGDAAETPTEMSAEAQMELPGSIQVLIGSAISAETLTDEDTGIPANDVRGILVDYNALLEDSATNVLTMSGEYNTLILEMRRGGSQLLDTPAVSYLIEQAKIQNTQLIALISCLDDSDYALAHQDIALKIDGGALWVDDNHRYFLDPTKAETIEYLAGIIRQLSEMGFDEVILNNFYFPTTSYVKYDSGGFTRDALLEQAYNDLVDATLDYCDLGLLITDPGVGHQAMDVANRIYVFFSEGGQVAAYAAAHPDHYLVFITDSHDTRFDDYGKIETDQELDLTPLEVDEDEDENGDEPTDGDTDDTEGTDDADAA